MNSEHKTFIIAEPGVNHNGDLSVSKKLIDVARNANAHAIKFKAVKTMYNLKLNYY